MKMYLYKGWTQHVELTHAWPFYPKETPVNQTDLGGGFAEAESLPVRIAKTD